MNLTFSISFFVREEDVDFVVATATTKLIMYQSCKYTDADEQYIYVQFQVMCVLGGALAFASARKQKNQFVTLFDQRKQAAQTPPPRHIRNSGRKSSNETLSSSVEMMASSNSSGSETTSLMANNAMDMNHHDNDSTTSSTFRSLNVV